MNELDGWAVTEAEIARTNDGGLTWYNVTPPEMEETGYGVDTFILDVEHAWVQKPDFENFPNGGFLYRTTDGGLTWTEFSVPFSRGDINFVDGDNGWALADLGVGAGSNAVAVYRTTSGGAVWERMYTNDPNDPESGDSLPLGGIKSDLVPLDEDTAWVTGTVYAPGEVYLHRTEDSGRTWTPVTVQLPENAQNFELGIEDEQMKFVSGTHGFLALRMSGESIQTVVYVTENAGNTWTLMPTVIEGAGPSAFLSEQEAVLYNGEQFYVTRDAARSWSMISPDIVFAESFVGMEFVNLLSGWVITIDPSNHKSLYRTHDGGATWLPVIP
jgi:photosystem II stability/assembly factor-like uncharacterized protein